MFPDPLKIVKVTSVSKTGDPKEISNYRQISALPCFQKILERNMYNRFYSYLVNEKNIIFEVVRFPKSSFQVIAQLAHQIHESFENDNYTLGAGIDLYKYLARIIKLLKKIENYGIKGTNLAWFRSYLKQETLPSNY